MLAECAGRQMMDLSRTNDRGPFIGVRKVRASQGRMPDNVRWRRLQGKCNRNIPPILAMPESGKGGRAVQETTAFLVTGGAYVNPIRSKTEQKR